MSRKHVESKDGRPRCLPEIVDMHEKLIVMQALQSHGWNRTRAAESLGVSRRYLLRRMKILEIDRKAIPRPPMGRQSKRDLVVIRTGDLGDL